MSDLDFARTLAAKAHKGQKYGEDDYTVHLNEVEVILTEIFPGEDRLPIIGQLHDILEDTNVTADLLRTVFDDDIVDAVVAMTKHSDETRDNYLIRCRSNPLGRKGKIGDAFCNLRRSIMRGDMKRVKRYGETLAILATGM